MAGKYNDIEDVKREEESRQQRILKAKEDLAAAELELASLPPSEPPKNEFVGCVLLLVLFLMDYLTHCCMLLGLCHIHVVISGVLQWVS